MCAGMATSAVSAGRWTSSAAGYRTRPTGSFRTSTAPPPPVPCVERMAMMARREPIVVGGQTFATKKDLRAHVVALRSRYPTGTTLAGPDATFMVELVARHE